MILSQSLKNRAGLAGLYALLLLSLFLQTRDGRTLQSRVTAYAHLAPNTLAATSTENRADKDGRYWAKEHHVIEHPSYTNFSVTD